MDIHLRGRLPIRLIISCRIVGDVGLIPAIGVHDKDIAIAVGHNPGEGNLCPIGRPGRFAIIGPIIHQPLQAATVRIHDVNVVVAAVFAGIGKLSPIGRPGRLVIFGAAVGQIHHITAVAIRHINIKEARLIGVTAPIIHVITVIHNLPAIR